jgi:ATP-dependent Clp protease ATP-binding subunit ClpA
MLPGALVATLLGARSTQTLDLTGVQRVLSKTLEERLDTCFMKAREQRHRWVGVQHLLLALLEEPTVQAALRLLELDDGMLRTDLERIVARTERYDGPVDEWFDTESTPMFQKAMGYAWPAVENTTAEVTPLDVFDAIVAHAKELKLELEIQRLLHRTWNAQ